MGTPYSRMPLRECEVEPGGQSIITTASGFLARMCRRRRFPTSKNFGRAVKTPLSPITASSVRG